MKFLLPTRFQPTNRRPMADDDMPKLLLLSLLFLTACSSAPPTSMPPIDTETPYAYSFATETPVITPTYEGCFYVWAYHDLPEISEKVDQAIKTLQTEASGRAQAYGEDCVYADGRGEFGAMETDFYVTIMVKNLKDESELGDWLIAVMKTLDAFPRGVVPGGQDGFAQITFKTEEDQRIFNVSINEYKNLPPGLSGEEVFRALLPNQ